MTLTNRTTTNLAGLNAKFRARVVAFLESAQPILSKYGVSVEVLSGLRSWPEQAKLYAQGRNAPGKIVTNARPGSSWHNYGLAVDLGLFSGRSYLDESNPALAEKIHRELGALWVSQGNEWAGNWKSFPETCHYQWTAGKTMNELRTAMESNGYDVQKLV